MYYNIQLSGKRRPFMPLLVTHRCPLEGRILGPTEIKAMTHTFWLTEASLFIRKWIGDFANMEWDPWIQGPGPGGSILHDWFANEKLLQFHLQHADSFQNSLVPHEFSWTLWWAGSDVDESFSSEIIDLHGNADVGVLDTALSFGVKQGGQQVGCSRSPSLGSTAIVPAVDTSKCPSFLVYAAPSCQDRNYRLIES